MKRRILVIDGHPDSGRGHFVHGLAAAYREASLVAGHAVRTIEVARLEFPLLRSARQFQSRKAPAAIAAAQRDIKWAQHLVFNFI